MRDLCGLIGGLAILANSASASLQTVTGQHAPGDVEAITAAIAHVEDGWSRFDSGLAVNEMTDDAYWINAFGIEAIGKPAIHGVISKLFDRHRHDAPRIFSDPVETIQFVRPDVALVQELTQIGNQKWSNGTPMPVRKTHQFTLMIKQNGHWQIAATIIMDNKVASTVPISEIPTAASP